MTMVVCSVDISIGGGDGDGDDGRDVKGGGGKEKLEDCCIRELFEIDRHGFPIILTLVYVESEGLESRTGSGDDGGDCGGLFRYGVPPVTPNTSPIPVKTATMSKCGGNVEDDVEHMEDGDEARR